MRYFLLVFSICVFFIGTFVFLGKFKQKLDSTLSAPPVTYQISITPTPTYHKVSDTQTMVFVPYWAEISDLSDLSAYSTLVYFGVAASEKGINKQDPGYTNLSAFLRAAKNKEKYLTVRMLESSTNFTILKDEEIQEMVISQSIQLAKENGFKGILLNIELSALPFDSLVDQITEFNKRFSIQAQKNNILYGITAYGDTFYRVRPFDIPVLAKHVDKLYIMAYDFHKAKGNPGPNFPLKGREVYGYDFETMIGRFLEYVPHKKIVVVFGMYGYDWQVDENGVPQSNGEPKSLKEIKNNYIDSCIHLSCEWRRDTPSSETEIIYTSSDNARHIIWFEDMESVKRKQDFLKNRGISSYALWAYSYF